MPASVGGEAVTARAPKTGQGRHAQDRRGRRDDRHAFHIDGGGVRLSEQGTDPNVERGGFGARIIAGSMRQAGDIRRSFMAGAHIATVPYRLLVQMAHHPRTAETIREFGDAWEEARRQGRIT